MKFNEFLYEDKQLNEAVPKPKTSSALAQTATALTKGKPNTMANAPVSKTNTASANNPNVPTYGKGTAMPTKPFQVPGAATSPTPPAAKAATAPAAPTAEPAPQATAQPTDTSAPEKTGLLYKMGKGIGDFGRGFKIGYGGRTPTDSDVTSDEDPELNKNAASSTAPSNSERAVPGQGGTTYQSLRGKIDKLDKKGKQRILGLLQKELGISAKLTPQAAAKPTVGANAMASMAGQLSGTKATPASPTPTPSSTGGQTTKTATGTQHTAKPAATPAKATQTTPSTSPARKGGRVKGQLSQTPNAVRKRTARATAKPVQTAGLERSGNMIAEGFSLFRKQL